MEREKVYSAIDSERHYQGKKWKDFDDSANTPADWVIYMERHLDKCKDAIYDSHNMYEFKNHLRKVVALGVAAGEQFGLIPRYQDWDSNK